MAVIHSMVRNKANWISTTGLLSSGFFIVCRLCVVFFFFERKMNGFGIITSRFAGAPWSVNCAWWWICYLLDHTIDRQLVNLLYYTITITCRVLFCLSFADHVNYFASFWYKFAGCHGHIPLGSLSDCLKSLLMHIAFSNFGEISFSSL